MLFHISEQPDIQCFEPRATATDTESDAVVWAVDAQHLRNYLAPRECPRVTFCATENTIADDRDRFLQGANAVVAIERGWLERIHSTTLYCYHFSPESFACRDAGAGYFVSNKTVYPVHIEVIPNVLDALSTHNTTLRVVSNLWQLHDAVAASTLQFSMIRMRNAAPRIAPIL